MSHTRILGEAGYPDLLDKDKNMVYVSDTFVYTTIGYGGTEDPEVGVWTVKFKVMMDNKEVLVTATKTNNFSRAYQKYIDEKKLYNEFMLMPNIRYVKGVWREMDEETFNKAIEDGDKELVDGLLEHESNYSRWFLVKSVRKLMGCDGESKNKKARKGDK